MKNKKDDLTRRDSGTLSGGQPAAATDADGGAHTADSCWTVEQGHNDFDIVAGNSRIAGYIQDERHADMMAASPELLAACRGVAAWLAEFDDRFAYPTQAAMKAVCELAIAKAEGR
jgi:hypothetical protein